MVKGGLGAKGDGLFRGADYVRGMLPRCLLFVASYLRRLPTHSAPQDDGATIASTRTVIVR